MSYKSATFGDFDSYKLTGVKSKHRELGRGSYAVVLELDYLGLKCAGKKIHHELLKQGDTSYTVRRFEDECRLLSRIRHPNIVQFLGVLFLQDEIAPILVMEFLPTNLTSCIETYGTLPKVISYSILHDVAVGLCYLHSQPPPIIHRDLSSNNVLLTPNMNAKISDLGVARILSLSPLQVSRMTQTPGTPAFMPPEVMVADPKYDTSVDVFSFGVLLMHILCGRWPEPQIGPNRIDPETDRLIPVSEAERREVFLESIGHAHPLMELILKCIDNNPKRRAHASEIVGQLTDVVSQIPTSFDNRLEMLRHIETIEEEKRVLTEDRERKLGEAQEKEKQIVSLREEGQAKDTQKSEQMNQLRLALSTEVEQQRLHIDDLVSQICVLKAEKKTLSQNAERTLTEKKALAGQMNEYKQATKNTLKQFEEKLYLEREKQQQQLTEEKLRYERVLQEEREGHDKVTVQNSELQVEIHTLRTDKEFLQKSSLAKDDVIVSKDAELEVKDKALRQKDVTISGMSKQLNAARQFLMKERQISITWSLCANVPIEVSIGTSTVVNGKVYFGGGVTSKEAECNIYCYDPLQDEWSTLPPLNVRHFSLGRVDDTLVAVGGAKKRPFRERTNEVFTFNENTRKWKKTYPAMPTARSSTLVFSLDSVLIVTGGYTHTGETTVTKNVVEVFKVMESQWYTSSELPVQQCHINMSGVLLHGNIYIMGGIRVGVNHNEVVYASVDDLCTSATANQTKQTTSTSPWKVLPDTPTSKTAATMLAGSLITLGGEENSCSKGNTIHVYSPSTNSWINVGSSIPAPRVLTTVTVLSPTEIMMIGGFNGTKDVNIVYKGTLQLTT